MQSSEVAIRRNRIIQQLQAICISRIYLIKRLIIQKQFKKKKYIINIQSSNKMQNQQTGSQHPNNNQRNGPQIQPEGGIMLSRPLPPTLLRINADNQDKRAVCIFWIVFFVVIVIISIASSFLPIGTFKINNIDQQNGTNLQNCQNPVYFDSQRILNCDNANSSIKYNTVGALMLNLRRQNQFAVVYINAYLIDNSVPQKQQQTNITATFYTVISDKINGKKVYKALDNITYNQTFKFYYQDSFKILGDDGKTLLGYEIPVFVVRNFMEESFVLIVQFQKNITDYVNINQFKANVLLVNPQFTKYSFAIRYIFFISSLAACVFYIYRFRKIPQGQRILQQKMIVVLSVLCVLFNDPFYPITVLQPNKVSSYFSVFFVINFVVFLIFLWIIFLDRILFEDGQKQTKLLNWKRIVYIIITYILVLILYTIIAMDHIEGLPIVPAQDLLGKKFVLLSLAALLFVLLGFCYIIVNYIRLCMKADELLWRNQLFLFFSVFFIIMTIALFFVNGFQINSFAGNRILLLYTVMNMYTFYMQYMYSISNEESQRVRRGQVDQNGMGLLQVMSGDGDCVDLQFDDMPGSKISSDEKFENKLNKKTVQVEKLLKQRQREKQDEMFSPKFDDYYSKDLNKPQNNKQKEVDFFKKQKEEKKQQIEQESENKQPKQTDFGEFSLDDE